MDKKKVPKEEDVKVLRKKRTTKQKPETSYEEANDLVCKVNVSFSRNMKGLTVGECTDIASQINSLNEQMKKKFNGKAKVNLK